MTYKNHPGIVMLKVCDVRLLVAKRENWDAFPAARLVSKTHAVLWAIMEKGRNSDETLISLSEIFKKPIEEVHRRFDPVIEDLAANGYIIPVEEEKK